MTDSLTLSRGSWREYAWVGVVVLLFVPMQIAALWAASSITSALGVGFPEREHFAVVAAMLGGLLVLLVVPLTARLLGHRVALGAGWTFALPILLAATAAFVIFEDVRSGFVFETDHALPEIFIPSAVLLLAAAATGHRLGGGPARRAWAWVARGTAALTIVVIGLTAAKMATTGGDFALDSPLTALVLVVVGAHAVVVAARVR